MALINYTSLNIFTINMMGSDPVRFVPGINQVTDKQLASLKSHPAFASFVEAGKLIIIDDPKSKDGERPVKEMLSLIEKMFDAKLLKQVIAKDEREEVQKAARAQLELITVSKKAEIKEENEHFK